MRDDDPVRAVLTETARWGERNTHLPGPAHIRRRARTRSRTTVAAAAALTLAAIVSTVVGVATLARSPGQTPAVVADAPPSSTPTTAPVSAEADLLRQLDFGLRESSNGETIVALADKLPVDVCPGQGLPGADRATAHRILVAEGPEYRDARGVLVFADSDAASDFLTGLEAAAARCASGVPRPEGGTREVADQRLAGAWGAGLALLLVDAPAPDSGPQPIVGATLLLAARRGSAVALTSSYGDQPNFQPYRIDPAVLAAQRRPLDALAPQLCRWTAAGC